MAETYFVKINLGSEETPSILVLDVNKLCYLSYKPETQEQTAKLMLDFGTSQKMFEKKEAEQVYLELMKLPTLNRKGSYY